MRVSSQNVTENKKDTIVRLTPTVARKVIKDLIRYDGLKLEKEGLDSLVVYHAQQNSLLNDKIKLLEVRTDNLNNVIVLTEEKVNTLTKVKENLERENKVERRKTWFYKITTIVASLTLGYFIVK